MGEKKVKVLEDKDVLVRLDYDMIYSYVNKFNTSVHALGKCIGLSPQGFARSLKNKTLTVLSLEKIAANFNVHPSTFFPPDKTIVTASMSRIQHLEDMVVEKDKQLKDKEQIIELLKQKIK